MSSNRLWRCCLAAAVTLLASSSAAYADNATNTQSSPASVKMANLQQTIPGFLQSPYGAPSFGAPYGTTHALGDWGGIQPWLQKHGVYVALALYEGISGNVSGGRKKTYTVAGQVGSTVDIDFR